SQAAESSEATQGSSPAEAACAARVRLLLERLDARPSAIPAIALACVYCPRRLCLFGNDGANAGVGFATDSKRSSQSNKSPWDNPVQEVGTLLKQAPRRCLRSNGCGLRREVSDRVGRTSG